MIILHTIQNSPRLEYTVGVISEAIGMDIEITNNPGTPPHIPRIHYGKGFMDGYLNIPSGSLLFEKGISEQETGGGSWHDLPTIFPQEGEIPFDLLASVFYLVSRYEEYYHYQPDFYKRFPHEKSIAFRQGFLQTPLVNAWLCKLVEMLNEKFHTNLKLPGFSFNPTYDIDMAWSYRHKGITRNILGFLKTPSIERILVNSGLKKDPFDSFNEIENLHPGRNAIFFFLCATGKGRLDKNISPLHPQMKGLIKKVSTNYKTGLHPSWASNENISKLKEEKEILESTTGRPVIHSRQHYLRFTLPGTFRTLISLGILHEYSMGYGTINGFRASISTPFNWYDLELEQETPLKIHPFCFMDANSHFEQKQDADTSYNELLRYMEICKKYHCNMITIFHNNFLGTAKEFRGWRELYSAFISQVQQ